MPGGGGPGGLEGSAGRLQMAGAGGGKAAPGTMAGLCGGTAWHGWARLGLAQLGTAQHSLARLGTARRSTLCQRLGTTLHHWG